MSETAWDTAELKFLVLLKLILSGTPTLAVQRPSSQPGGPALGGLGRVNGPAPGFALAHLQHQDLEHVPVPRWPPADSPEEDTHRRGRAPFRVFPSLLTPVNFTGKSRFSHCWPPASALRRGPHLLPSWPPRPCAPSSAPSPGSGPAAYARHAPQATLCVLQRWSGLPGSGLRRAGLEASGNHVLRQRHRQLSAPCAQRPGGAAGRDPEPGKELRRKSAKAVGPGITWFKGSWGSRGHGFHSLACPTIEGPGTPTSTVFPVLRTRVAAGGRLRSWSTARRPSPLSASWPAFTSWP